MFSIALACRLDFGVYLHLEFRKKYFSQGKKYRWGGRISRPVSRDAGNVCNDYVNST
jgi:hypothetical protein